MLKVSSPQPPMDDMPPMNDMGGDGMEQMGDMAVQPPMDDMPPMNDMGGDGMGGEFDTNFDAGVDADEETDPKKYIQQLTGKLSQTLRKYNSEQAQPDADLSKYVCGMIVKQAIEGLDNEDTDEIIKKIKSDEDFEEPSNNEQTEQMDDMDAQPPMDAEQGQMPMESINRRKQIDEVFQDLISTEDEEDNVLKTTISNNSFRKKPFTSPRFK